MAVNCSRCYRLSQKLNPGGENGLWVQRKSRTCQSDMLKTVEPQDQEGIW